MCLPDASPRPWTEAQKRQPGTNPTQSKPIHPNPTPTFAWLSLMAVILSSFASSAAIWLSISSILDRSSDISACWRVWEVRGRCISRAAPTGCCLCAGAYACGGQGVELARRAAGLRLALWRLPALELLAHTGLSGLG